MLLANGFMLSVNAPPSDNLDFEQKTVHEGLARKEFIVLGC